MIIPFLTAAQKRIRKATIAKVSTHPHAVKASLKTRTVQEIEKLKALIRDTLKMSALW